MSVNWNSGFQFKLILNYTCTFHNLLDLMSLKNISIYITRSGSNWTSSISMKISIQYLNSYDNVSLFYVTQYIPSLLLMYTIIHGWRLSSFSHFSYLRCMCIGKSVVGLSARCFVTNKAFAIVKLAGGFRRRQV